MSAVGPAPARIGGEERRVVLRPLQALDPGARLSPAGIRPSAGSGIGGSTC